MPMFSDVLFEIERVISEGMQFIAGHLQFLAVGAAAAAAIAAWLSAREVRRAAQGNLIANYVKEYASAKMCDALRTLGNWRHDYGKKCVEVWWERLLDGDAEAEEVDKARRYVSHFFGTAKELKEKKLIGEEYYQLMAERRYRSDLLKEVIEPMSELPSKHKFPRIPRTPVKKACNDCTFYKSGRCHLRPEAVCKKRGDWCGQFKRRSQYTAATASSQTTNTPTGLGA